MGTEKEKKFKVDNTKRLRSHNKKLLDADLEVLDTDSEGEFNSYYVIDHNTGLKTWLGEDELDFKKKDKK